MRRNFSFIPIIGILLLVFLCSAQTGYSSVVDHTEDNLLTVISPSQDQAQEKASLQHYELVLQKEPDNFQAILSAAYIHLRLGWLYSNKVEEKEHFGTMLKYSERALQLEPHDYQARLLNIIARAKNIGYASQREQVHIVWALKKDLSALMAIRSDDPDSIYVLSWLNFKVGQINSMNRFFATILFGGLPEDLTIENAISLMKKAIALRPNYSIYSYDLGVFNQRLGQLKEASKLFKKVLSTPPQKPEEIVYRERSQKRLQKIGLKRLAKN